MTPLIGILQIQKIPPRYFTIGQAEFMDLMIFTLSDLHMSQHQISGLLLQGENWVPQSLPLPEAVYNRVYTRDPSLAKSLESKIGASRVFNTITQLDKWIVAQILQKSPVREFLPKTRLYTWQAMPSLFGTSKATIIKPRYGHLGRDIYLLKPSNSSWQLLKASTIPLLTFKVEREAKRYFSNHFLDSRWILQEFVSGQTWQDRIFDLRYLVQKGALDYWAVTGRLARVALKGYYVTNICKTILPVEELVTSSLQTKLEEISLQTAKSLQGRLGHLGELSVDFILDSHGKPWIIEVNGLPAKELFLQLKDPPTLQKIHRSPLEYAYYLGTRLK